MERDKHYPYWLAGMSAIAGVLVVFGIANLAGTELKPGAMGKPVPGYGIDLVDADGNPVKLKAAQKSGRYTKKNKKKK